jgi:hypothetical protein
MKRIRKCPRCNSAELRGPMPHPEKPQGTLYQACADCLAVWEAIPEGEHFKRDGEQLAFREPCDNCAFRPGSPESQDKPQWRDLMTQLKAGGSFYCHKGVPLVTVGQNSNASFDFPKGTDGKEDMNRMRLCRGYLNAWNIWMRQRYPQEAV